MNIEAHIDVNGIKVLVNVVEHWLNGQQYTDSTIVHVTAKSTLETLITLCSDELIRIEYNVRR